MKYLVKFVFLSVFLFASIATSNASILAKNEKEKRKQLPSISAISGLTPEEKKFFSDRNNPYIQSEPWKKVSEEVYFWFDGMDLQDKLEKKRDH